MRMKKSMIGISAVAIMMSSCGSYAGAGAYTGAQFGTILGSAIGGIAGGWRGSDIGSIVGMAGGAAVGAAIGSAADRAAEENMEQRAEEARRQRNYERNRTNRYEESGYDETNGHDDRIDFDGAGPRDRYTAAPPRTYTPSSGAMEAGYRINYNSKIEIRNARFIDHDHDGVLRAGEECKVTFEIMNRSSKVLYDVQPTVIEVTNNKHIHVSPNLHVESIAPNSGVRYTASILADRRLKDGEAVIRVAVAQGNKEITSQVQEFVIQTRRK